MIEQPGDGGMGTVYLAEQREPVRRLVALNVMRTSLAPRCVLDRVLPAD